MQANSHIPVLKQEAVAALNIQQEGVYLDATLGRAGHALAIRKRLTDKGQLYVIDRDPEAISHGLRLFANDSVVTVLEGDFARADQLLAEAGCESGLDGVLLDLGVSSPQLDQAERGFSFMREGKLDMRMNPNAGVSAAEWLEQVEEADLVKVLFELGEERFARRIARAIVEARQIEPLQTTSQLVNVIEQSVPKKDKNKHPATRTFQAIRLHINGELDQISKVLPKLLTLLNPGGRLVVISFHSLEDRIVKRFIRQHSTPNLPHKSIPVDDSAYQTVLRQIGKAIKPSEQEIQQNPRSRSSVMRVAERTEVAYA